MEEEAEDDYIKSLSGDSKCKTKFWRCIAKVVKGGAHYMEQPGGMSGYRQI